LLHTYWLVTAGFLLDVLRFCLHCCVCAVCAYTRLPAGYVLLGRWFATRIFSPPPHGSRTRLFIPFIRLRSFIHHLLGSPATTTYPTPLLPVRVTLLRHGCAVCHTVLANAAFIHMVIPRFGWDITPPPLPLTPGSFLTGSLNFSPTAIPHHLRFSRGLLSPYKFCRACLPFTLVTPYSYCLHARYRLRSHAPIPHTPHARHATHAPATVLPAHLAHYRRRIFAFWHLPATAYLPTFSYLPYSRLAHLPHYLPTFLPPDTYAPARRACCRAARHWIHLPTLFHAFNYLRFGLPPCLRAALHSGSTLRCCLPAQHATHTHAAVCVVRGAVPHARTLLTDRVVTVTCWLAAFSRCGWRRFALPTAWFVAIL